MNSSWSRTARRTPVIANPVSQPCHTHSLAQAKGEVDQLSKLTRDRSNLAFDSATVSVPAAKLAVLVVYVLNST